MNTSSRTKALLYMLVLFLAGGVVGSVIQKHYTPAAPQPLRLNRTAEIAGRIRDKLKARLNLTDDQLAKADPLIQQAAQKVEDSHSQCLTQIDCAVSSLHSAIIPFLTKDQLKLMQQLDSSRADSMLQKYGYHSTNTVSK